MSTYRFYQEARDTAWRALLRLPEKRLPVDIDSLALQVGMTVHPFPDEKEEPRLAAFMNGMEDAPCVSLRIRGAWHVFLRDNRLNVPQRRFAVAHELGHLLLAHPTRILSPGVRAFESRENQGDIIEDPDDLTDYAADIFAIRVLAPACLLHELNVEKSGDIAALCVLPPRAAALRAERMELLNERNAFYSHTLERQVRDQFLPFLRSAQSPSPALSRAPARPVSLVTPLPPEKRQNPHPKKKRFRAALLIAAGLCFLAGAALLLFLKK